MPGRTEALSELERRQQENRDANRRVLQELGLLELVSRSGGGTNSRSAGKLSNPVGSVIFARGSGLLQC